MFKRIVLLIFLSFVLNNLFCQNKTELKHIIDAGYGICFMGTGDLLGQSCDVEYSYLLTSSLAFTSRIMYSKGENSKKEGIFNKAQTSTFDLGLKFVPFPKSLGWLSVNFGGSLRYVDKENGFVSRKYDEKGQISGPIYHTQGVQEKAVGLTSVLNMRIVNLNKIIFGTKGTMQAFYTNGDINWSLSAYLGYTF